MSTTLQIICNPYTKKITYKQKTGDNWKSLDSQNPLLKYDGKEFSYIATEVVKTIYESDYKHVIFEGSDDDYEEFEYAAQTVQKLDKKLESKDELICERSKKHFKNAGEALKSIESEFDGLLEILSRKYSGHNKDIKKEIEKFSETVSNEIPIVVMGTYSSGKSAFINALIGLEVLPSATTTTTAKTHRIRKSSSTKKGRISFKYDGDDVDLFFNENDFEVKTISEKDFCINLYSRIKDNSKDNTIESYIFQTLKLLNEKDICDSRSGNKRSHLSDLIEIEVPSNNCIFGDKRFNFSILDTPGSDSADKGTDKTHFEILKEALKNQTNGLPIFVTVPESMNSAGNKEILEEMKKINLDKNNMIIIANKADLTPDAGIEKLLHENDVIREWQSTRIYFVSAITGLAGQKKGEIYFYNDEYEDSFGLTKARFVDKSNPKYRELYAFNIMPDMQKQRITQKCQNNVETGDKKKLLFANSGIQCVVEEVFSYGEKHALYNKCANAKKYLSSAIDIVQKEILQKKQDIAAPAEEIAKKLDEKRKNLIEQLKQTSRNLSEQIISQYPNILSSKKDYKMEDKMRKIGKEWVSRYEMDFKKELNERGVDSISSIQRVEKKFNVFTEKFDSSSDVINRSVETIRNKSLKTVAKFGMNFLNTAKKGLEATGKTLVEVTKESFDAWDDHTDGMKIVRAKVRKEVEKSLLEDVKDIDISLYSESRDYFKKQEKQLRNDLIAFVTNKEKNEISSDEQERIKDVILKFPELEETGEEADLLQDSQIAHYLFGKFIDLGDINYKKLAEASKEKLREIVNNQTYEIQDDFKKSFLVWQESLISKIEEEITSLNPDLADWSKEKLRLENELKELKRIDTRLTSSEDNLEKLLSA